MGNEAWIAAGATEDAIDVLQGKLGRVVPQSFRQFLGAWGGVSAQDACTAGVLQDVVPQQKDPRLPHDFPHTLWAVAPESEADGDGVQVKSESAESNDAEYSEVQENSHLPSTMLSELMTSTFPEFLEKWFMPACITE